MLYSLFIFFRDHIFDRPLTKTRHRRKSGLITKPGQSAHGERGVRQYNARDDSKRLAHHRLGMKDLPD